MVPEQRRPGRSRRFAGPVVRRPAAAGGQVQDGGALCRQAMRVAGRRTKAGGVRGARRWDHVGSPPGRPSCSGWGRGGKWWLVMLLSDLGCVPLNDPDRGVNSTT